MTPRERLLADIRRLADGLPCVSIADGRLRVGVHEARLAGLEPEPDGRSGPEGDAAMAEACSKASAVRTGDGRLALLLELARTDLLPGGVGWKERLQDACGPIGRQRSHTEV